MNNTLVVRRKWTVVDPALLYVVNKITIFKLLFFEFFFLDGFYYTSNYNAEYKDAR